MKTETKFAVLSFVVFALAYGGTVAAQPKSQADSTTWYVDAGGQCMKEPGPADFIRAGKSQGATITAKDITEGGKVVETTLHVEGMGVTVRYFRSLERCKSRLLAERQGVEKDVGRYR